MSEEGENLKFSRYGVDSERVAMGEFGEYDQNTLYNIFKELIKYLKIAHSAM